MKFIFTLIICISSLSLCYSQDSTQTEKKYGFTFSFPWFSSFHYQDYELNKASKKSGFFGLGCALYYKQGVNKISFNAAFTEDLSSPIGTINYAEEGKQTHISAGFADIMLHRPIKKDFYAVVGFNYTSYIFQYTTTLEQKNHGNKIDNCLGGTFGIEYRFNNYFSTGLFYRPSFASFETDNIYRNVVSVDVRVDLDFKTKKK
jgi:hypothetical protein